MYDISQFKPSLYALLLLGMLGFGLASESPGVWALGTGGILLNAWLVKTKRFSPMPRLMANIVTIASMLYVAREVFAPGSTPVMVIGKFLVLLQLIKLWEQRANRDYAQLIVLSLLLMVAASINTTSLIFALLLIAFLFLALYCCLLFHLKVESDRARAAFPLSQASMGPTTTLRQDERFLGRSMRRLTAFVSGVSIATAVVVFLLFPRGAGAGMFGPMQMRPAQALTGFSENVNFQTLAKITQSEEQVARVEVTVNGQPATGTEPLLLRGVTLDQYNTKSQRRNAQWQWVHSSGGREFPKDVDAGEPWRLPGAPPAGGDGNFIRQNITLYPTGTRALFAIGGLVSITPERNLRMRYSTSDGVVQAEESLTKAIKYEVVSSNVMRADTSPLSRIRQQIRARDISAEILKYASRPDVSGTSTGGAPLLARRPRTDYANAVDEEIARNIERHLRANFAYTLDLTDAAKLRKNDDPMVSFLYDLKRGHCEYFAGAMALMCQSVGMQARVVNGFKSSEFNDMGGGYYIVRQSHAHSWVEVLTVGADGARFWKTFDPTSSREEDVQEAGMWLKMKHLFDFVEFSYANAVIGYDNDNRESLITNVENRMQNSANLGSAQLQWLRTWLDSNIWSLSSNAIGAIVVLMVLALIGFVSWYLGEKWMLRRKAARIGLDNLPPSDQARLVRQLAFYDDLVRLLARHHITRPKHLTPLEFSQTLLYLPSEAYETIRRLTQVFYRVRYGSAELTGGQRRRLGAVISRLEEGLSATAPNSASA